MTTPSTPLDNLADLLDLALNDLEKIERRPGYVVDMSDWHVLVGAECHVCLAGAFMAGTLELPPIEEPSGLDLDIWLNALLAIDDLRTGRVERARNNLGCRSSVPDRDVPRYEADKEGWWKAMRQLLTELKTEKEGR